MLFRSEIILPTKDETVLLYDQRNNNHNRIFVDGSPSGFPSSVYDVDTNNIYKFTPLKI